MQDENEDPRMIRDAMFRRDDGRAQALPGAVRQREGGMGTLGGVRKADDGHVRDPSVMLGMLPIRCTAERQFLSHRGQPGTARVIWVRVGVRVQTNKPGGEAVGCLATLF